MISGIGLYDALPLGYHTRTGAESFGPERSGG